jgi:hypothetical protein
MTPDRRPRPKRRHSFPGGEGVWVVEGVMELLYSLLELLGGLLM